mmetsp:Transcript_28364/g.62333  ORF Transcript_28364/g.62333 Transcript_28364/m.62333 type:complete len:723 (-) Transcript_28364:91-2259(-)
MPAPPRSTMKQAQQQPPQQLPSASRNGGAARRSPTTLIIENAPPLLPRPSPSSLHPPVKNNDTFGNAAEQIPNTKLKRLAFSQKAMSNIKLDDDTASSTSTAPTLISSTSSGFWSLSESSITTTSFDPVALRRQSGGAAAGAAAGGNGSIGGKANGMGVGMGVGGGNGAGRGRLCSPRNRSKSAPRPNPGKNAGDFRRVAQERQARAAVRPLANRLNAGRSRQKQSGGGGGVVAPPHQRPTTSSVASTSGTPQQPPGQATQQPRRVERAHLPKRPHPDAAAAKLSRTRSQSQMRPRPQVPQTAAASTIGAGTAPQPLQPLQQQQQQQQPSSARSQQQPQPPQFQRAKGRVASTDDALSFKDFYRISCEIDRGSFSRVYEAYHRYTAVKYAVKVIDRRSLSRKADDAVFREARILQELQNKHRSAAADEAATAAAACGFVRLVDFFIEPTRFFLVMDYMAGGPVFDRVLDRHFYTEDDARQLAIKLLKAVAFMHRHDVVHRDLKPQNILLVSDECDTSVKIADFGFATVCPMLPDEKTGKMTRKVLKQKCGTPSYVAPEVISGKGYCQAADMWSLGVIFFFVLGGYPPFVDYNSRQGMFQKIMAGDFDFHETDWNGVSSQAKEFIRGLLTVDPGNRLTASQALYHPWILGAKPSRASSPKPSGVTPKAAVLANKDSTSAHMHKKKDKDKKKTLPGKLKAAFGGAAPKPIITSRPQPVRRTSLQ